MDRLKAAADHRAPKAPSAAHTTSAGVDGIEYGDGIPCTWMRGGTSKGAFFLADDLPNDAHARNDLLLRIMGSPDSRQIDGIGGSTSLTSKVAVVSRSTRPDADVDYLFLQVGVDTPTVSDKQNCGNILAAVGQFAVETGLLSATGDTRTVGIHMVNSGGVVNATFPVHDGLPVYRGDTSIDGVPGNAAPVSLMFGLNARASSAGLFPTGLPRNKLNGVEVTCADNGMPVVIVEAQSMGLTGYESPTDLAADSALAHRVDDLRCAAGRLMGLGDVRASSIPKTVLVAPGTRRWTAVYTVVHPGNTAYFDRGVRGHYRGDSHHVPRRGGSSPHRNLAATFETDRR